MTEQVIQKQQSKQTASSPSSSPSYETKNTFLAELVSYSKPVLMLLLGGGFLYGLVQFLFPSDPSKISLPGNKEQTTETKKASESSVPNVFQRIRTSPGKHDFTGSSISSPPDNSKFSIEESIALSVFLENDPSLLLYRIPKQRRTSKLRASLSFARNHFHIEPLYWVPPSPPSMPPGNTPLAHPNPWLDLLVDTIIDTDKITVLRLNAVAQLERRLQKIFLLHNQFTVLTNSSRLPDQFLYYTPRLRKYMTTLTQFASEESSPVKKRVRNLFRSLILHNQNHQSSSSLWLTWVMMETISSEEMQQILNRDQSEIDASFRALTSKIEPGKHLPNSHPNVYLTSERTTQKARELLEHARRYLRNDRPDAFRTVFHQMGIPGWPPSIHQTVLKPGILDTMKFMKDQNVQNPMLYLQSILVYAILSHQQEIYSAIRPAIKQKKKLVEPDLLQAAAVRFGDTALLSTDPLQPGRYSGWPFITYKLSRSAKRGAQFLELVTKGHRPPGKNQRKKQFRGAVFSTFSGTENPFSFPWLSLLKRIQDQQLSYSVREIATLLSLHRFSPETIKQFLKYHLQQNNYSYRLIQQMVFQTLIRTLEKPSVFHTIWKHLNQFDAESISKNHLQETRKLFLKGFFLLHPSKAQKLIKDNPSFFSETQNKRYLFQARTPKELKTFYSQQLQQKGYDPFSFGKQMRTHFLSADELQKLTSNKQSSSRSSLLKTYNQKIRRTQQLLSGIYPVITGPDPQPLKISSRNISIDQIDHDSLQQQYSSLLDMLNGDEEQLHPYYWTMNTKNNTYYLKGILIDTPNGWKFGPSLMTFQK